MAVLTRSAVSSILNGERSVTDRVRRYNARCSLKDGSAVHTSSINHPTTATFEGTTRIATRSTVKAASNPTAATNGNNRNNGGGSNIRF